MKLTQTEIADVVKLTPQRFHDPRGLFSEVYNAIDLKEFSISVNFIQDNQVLNVNRGTLRGLHFQLGNHSQTKLVRCVCGAILDVAVDMRPGSGTYGQHVKAVLSADNWDQLLIPKGFAHGYLTLTDNVVVLYKVDQPYAAQHQGGLIWNDPDLAIDWGLANDFELVIADKDLALPRLRDLRSQND
jgi:dTDP-4-dehydrorhamnose 3,5-epimerase